MESPFQTSILKRAMDKGLVEVHFHHLRDWAINKHRQIDDEPYGGGAGMVMMVEPLINVYQSLNLKEIMMK